ncbi:ferric reduction oxidase 2-like [Vigna umbellata]|uniref:ferric reduction oxidase 2-like n=1 Tax=Vigna umbellata TaxID=87088 RepID=UPI001F5F3EAB|nr:ferric reduction oxidase 2-like [Vigna umbellata]
MNVEVEKKSISEEKYGRVQSVIRWLVLVVFLGWIFVWIMTPTNTYQQKWKHRLRAKTESVLDTQGANLLVYTSPILFIAALGCVYVHIANKGKDSDEVSIWKRLVLVRGPLGIVSATELAFLSMFIVLLLWSFSIYLHNGFAKITHKSAAEQGVKVWEKRLASAAVKLGLVGNICLAFLFFPVVRSSSVLPLVGLTPESCIKYHIWLGHIAMTLFTAHGILFIIYWAVTHQLSKMLEWKTKGISNVGGEVSLVAGLLMWIATIPRIRRKAFEVFFYTHYLYILFILFFIFHVGFSYACTMLPAFYLFLVDRYLRFLQSRYQVPLISARLLPCQTLQLNFSKSHGLTYSPTSIMFINIPSISKLQWHPFTITSNSNLEPEVLSVVIKGEGTWSQKLYHLLSTPSAIDHLSVSVEGPYGPASTNYLRYDYDTLVMVSGGSGITPFISIVRELLYLSTAFRCRTPKVVLICAFKNSSSLSMLDLILPNSGTPFDISNMQLLIEAYITREEEHVLETQSHVQDIRFKPKATDAPISAILGPNSWLWLCAIISSSFIIFLVLIGIITRYIIFPVDYNSNKIFSQSLGSFLSMLAICVSITMTASVAFLWNKKHNDVEAKQIQNLEGSPSADKEVESLPHQSLVQATKVHFGVRPDLRRMLMEVEGTRVGVFVSGPKKMKQEVAAICSSGLAENLHFKSYSFSW